MQPNTIVAHEKDGTMESDCVDGGAGKREMRESVEVLPLLHFHTPHPPNFIFLTHDGERAPAAAAGGVWGGEKVSKGAIRWIHSWTRSTDLDVLVYTVTDRTPLLR